ncbi:MAG: hypothetical protein ACK47M_08460 [Caldilinea sp.]
MHDDSPQVDMRPDRNIGEAMDHCRGLILTACAPAGPRPLDNIAVTPIPPAPPPAVAPPDQFITLDNADQMTPFARLGTGYIHRLLLSPDGRRLAIVAVSGIHVYNAT